MRNSVRPAPGGPVNGLVALRLVCHPSDPCWELRPTTPPLESRGLLGWIMVAPPVDAGMPTATARIVARTLCHAFQVSFLHPSGARASRRDKYPLLTTRDPATVEQLFYVDEFPWVLRGQIVLLAPPESPPPHISGRQLIELAGDRVIDAASLARLDFAGLMLPGVDGDFAEFVMLDDHAWRAVREGLAAACAAAGIEFQVVSEPEFRGTKWFAGPAPE